MEATIPQPAAKTVEGHDVTPKVGSYVELDGRPIGELLLLGDEPIGSWAGCQFRFPSNTGIATPQACNVEVTGRTLRRKLDRYMVRVLITWVGDGEPDRQVRGWMKVSF